MKIFVQQPSYLPWIGYFEQIYEVDTFVFFDDVRFTKSSWKNRNRIKNNNGEMWLTVPVCNRSSPNLLIKDAKIDHSHKWVNKHLKSIFFAYKKSRYFDEIYQLVETTLRKRPTLLLDLDCELIVNIAKYLGIDTNFVFSSSINCSSTHRELRLIEICNKLDANHLYNGAKAKEILDLSYFQQAGIQIEFQDFEHPLYEQLHGPFIPYLSIIDLLFNCGPDSGQYIWGGQSLSR